MNTPARLMAVAALALAFAAASAAWQRVQESVVLSAVEAESFAALSGRRAESAGDLWERLKAMGLSAVILRDETLSDLVLRGEAIHFDQAEIEKWKVAGLVSNATVLRPGTVWAKDANTLSRVAAAFAAIGIDVATTSVAGMRALEIPHGVDFTHIPAGFDPAVVTVTSSAGLIPVSLSSGPMSHVAGQNLWVRNLSVEAKSGEILRATMSRRQRLIVFSPKKGLGLEENIRLLRQCLHTIRQSGINTTLPAPVISLYENSVFRFARLFIVWCVGFVGPLLAIRAALHILQQVRPMVCATIPVASPVPQVLSAVFIAWVVAIFAGLVVVGIAPDGWRDSASKAWSLWTWCAPLIFGLFTLFSVTTHHSNRWSTAVRRIDLLGLAVVVALTVLLTAPRIVLRFGFMWDSIDHLSAADMLWWWPWHWRAVIIGVPALTTAFGLLELRDEMSAASGKHFFVDPRVWMLLGLLGTSDVIISIGASATPLGQGLCIAAYAWLGGLLVTAVLVALWGFVDYWRKFADER